MQVVSNSELRPYLKLRTAEIKEIIEKSEPSIKLLHVVYVELTHRDRKLARELREVVRKKLLELNTQYFAWPNTVAEKGEGQIDVNYFQHQHGILSFMGYKVGSSGLPVEIRQQLLSEIFSGHLPLLNSKEYMNEWGSKKSSRRLRKMAESIAAFVRNAKRRRGARLKNAVIDWETDLEYLRVSYYVGRFDFPWPDTSFSS